MWRVSVFVPVCVWFIAKLFILLLFFKWKRSAEAKLSPSSLFWVLVVSAARSSYRSGDAPVTAASLDSGLSGSAYSLLDEEEEANEVDSAIFHVPRLWVAVSL